MPQISPEFPLPTGSTAIVLPIPGAEPLVSAWRERFDKHAAMGVPAHITLLSPFLPPDQLDAARPQLQELLDQAPPRFHLSRLRAWPGLAVLEPQPLDWFHHASQALCHRWGLLPYGGRYGDTARPHLTVAYGDPDPTIEAARFASIAADLDPHLPLACELRELWILERRGPRWERRGALSRRA